MEGLELKGLKFEFLYGVCSEPTLTMELNNSGVKVDLRRDDAFNLAGLCALYVNRAKNKDDMREIILYFKDGKSELELINKEQELQLVEAAKVYDSITNGKLSKTNYIADVIIQEHEQAIMDAVDEATKDLNKRVDELEREVAVDDDIIKEYRRLLDLFECPSHGGGCVPNAIAEVKRLREIEKKQEKKVFSGRACHRCKSTNTQCLSVHNPDAPAWENIYRCHNCDEDFRA